jgi:tRNA A-37 threonylcarbamoyl transferase component Bud32
VQRIVFADSWSEFFAEAGLRSFDDFFEHLAAEAIGANNRRSVVTFNLGSGSHEKKFFMKRFLRPHFKDIFSARRNVGESCSQGRYEWENARLLLDNGIETYRPVCYGEETKWGIETKSFVVTEELRSECLSDFVREKWHTLERSQQEKIVAGLGAFVRRIHALNVSLPDLYVYHIYVTESAAGKYDFAVIDLHRMSRDVTNRNKKSKNLGRLHHSMLDDYFDNELKQLLVKSYAADSRESDVTTLVARVERLSAVVSAKRRKKGY